MEIRCGFPILLPFPVMAQTTTARHALDANRATARITRHTISHATAVSVPGTKVTAGVGAERVLDRSVLFSWKQGSTFGRQAGSMRAGCGRV